MAPGLVCLQGGAEFGPRCRELDAELLRRAAGGPVVVSALAAQPGRQHDTANRHGVEYFASLGSGAVAAAPDARSDEDAALAAIDAASLLVLPGGSPSRLLTALTATRMSAAVRGLLARGGTVLGCSAGAMVLAEHTWLPDRGGQVVAGLGLVPGTLVVPHWSAARQPEVDMLQQRLPDGARVLAIPEQTGVLVPAHLGD